MLNPATWALYAQGWLTTLTLLAGSLGAGGLLALALALGLTSRLALLRLAVSAYTFALRGTPLLIQVYLIYYGLAQWEWIQSRWDQVWPWTWFK